MRKYPRPADQQPAAGRHPFREHGLKFCRLLARGQKYVAIAKTSSPAEGGGSILPPNPRYSWVLSEQCCSASGVGGVSSFGLATQPFWFYTSFRHRQWGIFVAS